MLAKKGSKAFTTRMTDWQATLDSGLQDAKNMAEKQLLGRTIELFKS